MDITEAILHHIEKEQLKKEATLQSRDNLLPKSDSLSRLADSIHKRYSEKYVLHGSFIDNPEIHRFPVLLDQYLKGEKTLVEFSKLSSELISGEMAKKTMTTSSFAKFLRYKSKGKDWLLVLMLKTSAQTGINLKTLDLDDSYVFDLQHLHEAARIDIGKLQKDEKPYLTFVKPRSGKDDPSEFFRDALSCTDLSEPKQNTNAVIDALDSYAEAQSWESARRQEARKALYEHCAKKRKDNEPVVLEALSAIIDDQNPKSFWEHVAENDFKVDSTFDPHPATYKKLHRMSHRFSNINLSFDIEDLTSGNIDLTDVEGEIIIKNVPEKILAEIRKAKGQ